MHKGIDKELFNIKTPLIMKAEDVYNIAVYLSDNELEKLFNLLKKKVTIKQSQSPKRIKKKLISKEEAREYLLRTVFRNKY